MMLASLSLFLFLSSSVSFSSSSPTLEQVILELESVYVGAKSDRNATEIVARDILAGSRKREDSHVSLRNTNIPPFSCDAFSCSSQEKRRSATSVHELRFCDIDLIGAIGDSLTAAFGAKSGNFLTLPTEYRGISFSIGGDNNAPHTLPNYFKHFNPDIQGFSVGTGTRNAFLNQAVSGAVSSGLMSQAQKLVDQINEKIGDGQKQMWKVITILIGGNDLCDSCNHNGDLSGEYEANLREVLVYLEEELERAYVNLVPILDVSDVSKPYETVFGCGWLLSIACPCMTTSANRARITENFIAFDEIIQNLQYEYDSSTTFAVVRQPYLKDTTIPTYEDGSCDMSYFAIDCFHFNKLGHQIAAIGLWNNMLQPVHEKTHSINFGTIAPPLCPKVDSYLATPANSFTKPFADSDDSLHTADEPEESP